MKRMHGLWSPCLSRYGVICLVAETLNWQIDCLRLNFDPNGALFEIRH